MEPNDPPYPASFLGLTTDQRVKQSTPWLLEQRFPTFLSSQSMRATTLTWNNYSLSTAFIPFLHYDSCRLTFGRFLSVVCTSRFASLVSKSIECKLSKQTCCCVCFAFFPPLPLYFAKFVMFDRLGNQDTVQIMNPEIYNSCRDPAIRFCQLPALYPSPTKTTT
jgi:hypothetical protein